MHYGSYKLALDAHFANIEMPIKPLVIDIGCGPGTVLFALNDWRVSRNLQPVSAYIGIDNSQPFLEIAKALMDIAPPRVGKAEFIKSIGNMTDRDLVELLEPCDSVLYAMSYVIHQPFMRDMTPVADVMRRFAVLAGSRDAWLLLQDQNSQIQTDDPLVKIWPETRIRMLADHCEDFGYGLKVRKGTVEAPRLVVQTSGEFDKQPGKGTQNVCYFFTRLERI